MFIKAKFCFTIWLAVTSALSFSQQQNDSRNFHVIFNQPQYAVGDTAHFSIIALDKRLQTKSKSVLTIRLVNEVGNTLLHKRILLVNGTGWNYIHFPDKLDKGSYTLGLILEEEPVAYAVNWLVSDNGTIVRQGNTQNAEKCAHVKLEVDSTFVIREKVTAHIDLEDGTLQHITIASYNKELFSDRDNGLYASPDVVRRNQDYIPTRGPNYFRGKVMLKGEQKPAPDSTRVTFYLRNSNLIFDVFTRQGGYFDFPLFIDFSDDWVYYRTTKKNKIIDCLIELEEFSISPIKLPNDSTEFKLAYGKYAKIRKTIMDSYAYFKKGDYSGVSDSYETDIEADISTALDKYEPFKSMYEVFMNVVPMVKYRPEAPGQMRVFLKSTAGYGTADPLYIINGYMTNSIDFLADLDPKRVKKIGVLRTEKTLARFGELGRYGIILIEADLDNEIFRAENSLFIRGVSKSELQKPKQELDKRNPTLQASVFWWAASKQPTQHSFSFNTSNDTGRYDLQVFMIVGDKLCTVTKMISVGVEK